MTDQFAGPRRLAPHLAQVWRAQDRLQIGCGTTGVVLTGLGTDDRRVLDLLTRGISLAALDTDALRRGRDPVRRRALVTALTQRRMLVPTDPGTATAEASRLRAERWAWSVDQSTERSSAARQRPKKYVTVVGGTSLATPIASGFLASGVGGVSVVGQQPVTATDVVVGGPGERDIGRPLAAAAADVLGRLCDRQVAAGRQQPDLTVVIGRDAHDATAAATLVADDVAHLTVLVRDAEVVVGPLVVPGAGPCLHCLDLHFRDRDPQWPDIVTQLARPDDSRPPVVVPALGQVAAGIAVLLGLGHLDGGTDVRPGASATVALPLGEVTWRLWAAHAACGCVSLAG